jgi:hypothetical protein
LPFAEFALTQRTSVVLVLVATVEVEMASAVGHPELLICAVQLLLQFDVGRPLKLQWCGG